jgi:hypothetical protein
MRSYINRHVTAEVENVALTIQIMRIKSVYHIVYPTHSQNTALCCRSIG